MRNFDLLYKQILGRLLDCRQWRGARGTMSLDSGNVFTENLYYPLQPFVVSRFRRMNFRFATAEWFSMSCGLSAVEPVAAFNSEVRKFSDDGLSFTGAYGPMLLANLSAALERLMHDPWTRQAVVQVWRPELPLQGATRWTKDPPCTLQLVFSAEPEEDCSKCPQYLNMAAVMRSNDAWLGLPYDVFCFSQIHRQVARYTGYNPLQYSHVALSEHVYEQDIDRARELARSQDAGIDAKVFNALSSTPVPEMPVLMFPSRRLDACQLFTNVKEYSAEILGDGCDAMQWEGALPWLLFLRSKFEKVETTGDPGLDWLMREIEERKINA
jgi:thymidylate synthase